MSNKPGINFILDVFLFVCLTLMAGIGFLIKFTLLPGRESRLKYGDTVELTFLGWDRHDWGNVHLILGLVFLLLILLHIFLHWRNVVTQYKKIFANHLVRKFILALFILFNGSALLFGFFVEPESHVKNYRYGQRNHKSQVLSPDTEPVQTETQSEEKNPKTESETFYNQSCRSCHPQPGKIPSIDYNAFHSLLKKGHGGVSDMEEDDIKLLYKYIYGN